MPSLHSYRAVSCVSCCSTSRKKSHQKKTPPNQLQLTPNQLQLFQACLNRSFSRHKACNRMPSLHSYRAVSCVSCCSTSRKKSHQKKTPPNQLQLTPNQLQLFQACLNRSFSRHKACNRMPSLHSYRAVSCVPCCSTSRKKSRRGNNQQPTTTNNSHIQFCPQRKHKEPTKGNPRDLPLKVLDSLQESPILGRHNDA